MNILLIYPKFPKTFWSFDRAVALMGHQVLLPPLGLITVAALLPQTWAFKLVDCNIREVHETEWEWADLVICSAMLVQKRDLALQVKKAKDHAVPIAVGGPFATSTPDAPELAEVDYLILDEGEITLPLFVAALENGEAKGRFRSGGEKPDIADTPIPRFDLLTLKSYAMMAVQFSRGCPFQCEFCDIIVLYGRKPRTKTPEQLLAELEAIQALNWRGEIFLVDDNFIGNKRNVKRLLPELRDWQHHHGFPFSFTTEASIDLADDTELMQLMVSSGFNRVFLGIETPDTSSLTIANKHQNTRSPLEESVEIITAQGLLIMAGFILGFDGEKAGAGQRIVEFVNRTSIPLAMVGILQALPNTALWDRLEKEHRLIQADTEFDTGVQTNLLNFQPTRPMPEIATEFIEAFDQLYDPIHYLQRIYRYALKLGRKQSKPNLSPQRLLAKLSRSGAFGGLLHLIWRQGVMRETRFLFWRFLWSIIFTRPQVLEEYLWMSLLNEHFIEYRTIVREEVMGQLKWSETHRPEMLPAPAVQALGVQV